MNDLDMCRAEHLAFLPDGSRNSDLNNCGSLSIFRFVQGKPLMLIIFWSNFISNFHIMNLTNSNTIEWEKIYLYFIEILKSFSIL